MVDKPFTDRDFHSECQKYWNSAKRAEAREALLAQFVPGDADSVRKLFDTMNGEEDKDARNAAASELRNRARLALEALRTVAAHSSLAEGMGLPVAPLLQRIHEQAMTYRYLEARIFVPHIDRMDIAQAMAQLGVEQGDILLVHSSYTSLGHVLGGPQAVIDGLLDAIGEEGTLVMPTLIQNDFEHAYRDWHIDRPSEVGFLTEYFRKLPGVLRSDQATHSVAAIGKHAQALTSEHAAYGPRPCLFGEYAFGHSSPWQKMYDIGGKVVFLGAKANTNTFKHFIECCQVERRLDAVRDPAVKRRLLDGLWTFEDYSKVVAGRTDKAWPMYKSIPVTEKLDQQGFVRHTNLGDTALFSMDIQTMVRETTRILEEDLAQWYPEHVVRWFREADAAIEAQG